MVSVCPKYLSDPEPLTGDVITRIKLNRDTRLMLESFRKQMGQVADVAASTVFLLEAMLTLDEQ